MSKPDSKSYKLPGGGTKGIPGGPSATGTTTTANATLYTEDSTSHATETTTKYSCEEET